MKRLQFIVVIVGLLMAGFSQPAMAGDLEGPPAGYVYPGYVNAPDWSANPHFTRQSWDFLPVEDPSEPGTYMEPGLPIVTDAATHGGPGTVNPNGNPLLASTGPRIGYEGEDLDHAWEWTDYGMGMANDIYYGHIGGMGSGYVIFDIPNTQITITQQIWLQYIVYIPRGGAGPDGGTLTGFFLDEPEIDPLTGNPTNDPVGTMLIKEYEMICDTVGYSGYWWRVTEFWQLDSQPGEEWLWLATSGEGGAATLIDSVDIQTRSVEPSTVDTPTFSPDPGTTFTSSLEVTITCTTEDAIIYYTTDGNDPTETSTLYSGAITITETTAFKAKAFKTGWTPSAVAAATYTRTGTVATPGFSPDPGTYASALNVTISCETEGTTFYYTTDGTDPTESSTEYSGPVTISITTTLKARAFKSGWNPSQIASGLYTITGTTAMPAFSPPSGTEFTSSLDIEISCSTEGATIYYTTDDTNPTESSAMYTGAITITETTTSKAKAFKTGWTPSAVATATYTKIIPATVATPTFDPAPDAYTSAQSITISCVTEEAMIYYTTNGDDPTEDSTPYTGPVTISATTTLKAKAYMTDWDPSNIVSGTYTIEEDWSDNPYYTHQGWEFNSIDIDPDTPGWQVPECDKELDDDYEDSISPGVPGIIQEGNVDPDPPLAPDKLVNAELESYINDYGIPYLIYAHPLPLPDDPEGGAFDWVWYTMGGDWDRCGHYGGMGWMELIFKIPNAEVSERHLNLRLQFAEFSRDPAPGAWEVIVGRAYDPETHEILDTQSINMIDEEWITEIDGGGHPWHSVTQIWEFGDQPSVVYVSISALSPSATLVDEVVMDTRSVTALVPPKVLGISPENGATGVKVNSTISVSFTKPMDKEITEGVFSISPEVDGEFTWENLNKTLVFTPRSVSDLDYLDCNTEYSVTISKDARDVMGLNLQDDYTFSFTTETYTEPNPTLWGVPEGTVDTDEATITVGGNGVYRYVYQLDTGDLQGPFDSSQHIELSGLSDGEHILYIMVEDALGHWNEIDPVTWIVMAPPTVVITSPGDGKRAPTSTKIKVTFSEPMDKESVENALSIGPYVQGTFTWSGNTMTFTPDENLTPEITYTAAIDTSATDLAGNSLTEPHSWSFTTYVGTTTITCPVEADTYILMGSMGGGKGYPTRERLMAAGCCGINVCIDSRILVRFDISEIQQLEPEQIVKAEVCYYMTNRREGVSMEMEPPAPAGTPMYGFVYALDTMSFEYNNVQLDDPFIWTEAEQGNSNWVDHNKKPGYAPGVPMILATHTTGPFSPGRIDITEIVRGWVRGDYENNGIELKDHNDRSYVDLTHGEGFPWYWPSKEDSGSTKRTYLRVEVDAERLRITDKPGGLPELSSGESMDLDAEGGSGSYSWHATGPDKSNVTDQVLSETTGSATTFTAPDTAGIYKITVTDGAVIDSIRVGVSDPYAYRPDDKLYELSQTLFPLFMGGNIDSSDQEEIYKICENTINDIGTSGIPGSLGNITVINKDGENFVGGTGKSHAACTTIGIIENPATATQDVCVRDKNGNSVCKIEITEGDIDAGAGNKIYAVVTDTGIMSWGGASGVYSLALFNEDGEKVDNSFITNINITMSFNTDMIVSDQLRDGTCSIVYTDDTGMFFTAEGDDPKGSVPVTDIDDVDYDEGRVKFRVDHLTSFGMAGSGTEMSSGGGDHPGLGGGCFIGTATCSPTSSYSQTSSPLW